MKNTETISSVTKPPALPKVGNMVPLTEQWPSADLSTQCRAAVLLLFLVDPRETASVPHIVLTRRSARVHSHRGQISLPGGRCSSREESPAATALRESEEEVGLAASGIQLIGALKSFRAIDGCTVLPLVGWCIAGSQALVPNDQEVAEILLVDWTRLTRQESKSFQFNLFGITRNSYLFEVGLHRVWGLTASILHEANMQSPLEFSPMSKTPF